MLRPPSPGSPPKLLPPLSSHSWESCCHGQERAEAQVSHGSSSCFPGLTLCWLVKAAGGGSSPFRWLTTVLAPLPHPRAGLAGGEGAGVCWALWKDEPRVQGRARYTDRAWLEESLCPQWPKHRVIELIRDHSNWGEPRNDTGTPTTPPALEGGIGSRQLSASPWQAFLSPGLGGGQGGSGRSCPEPQHP